VVRTVAADAGDRLGGGRGRPAPAAPAEETSAQAGADAEEPDADENGAFAPEDDEGSEPEAVPAREPSRA
jgi:hypothetical protein